MKQKYVKPDLEVTKLLTEDIINTSAENGNDVFIDSDGLW